MYSRILIATDGSELSKKAVTGGIALTKSLGASIVAYHSVSQYPSLYIDGAMVLTASQVAQIEKQWQKQSKALLEAVQVQAQHQGVQAKIVAGVTKGSVAESIIAAAKKNKCDLIVMASHGRKGISRVLLGSETLDVLTHSRIPVLVLR